MNRSAREFMSYWRVSRRNQQEARSELCAPYFWKNRLRWMLAKSLTKVRLINMRYYPTALSWSSAYTVRNHPHPFCGLRKSSQGQHFRLMNLYSLEKKLRVNRRKESANSGLSH